jgi:hypothetical protein
VLPSTDRAFITSYSSYDRFPQPRFRGVLAGKDLEMVDVADFLTGVDIDPDSVHAHPSSG